MGYKFKIYSRRFFAWIPMHEFSSATKNPKAYWRNDRSVLCRTPSVCALTKWTFAILSQHFNKLSTYSLGLTKLRSEPVLHASLLLTTCAPSLQSLSQRPVLFRKEKSQPEAVVTVVLLESVASYCCLVHELEKPWASFLPRVPGRCGEDSCFGVVIPISTVFLRYHMAPKYFHWNVGKCDF